MYYKKSVDGMKKWGGDFAPESKSPEYQGKAAQHRENMQPSHTQNRPGSSHDPGGITQRSDMSKAGLPLEVSPSGVEARSPFGLLSVWREDMVICGWSVCQPAKMADLKWHVPVDERLLWHLSSLLVSRDAHINPKNEF